VEAALIELCVKYGYCIPDEKAHPLLGDVPDDADAFLAAVLAADGRDPALVDKRERQELRGVVCDWLFDPQGRGAKSGLPRGASARNTDDQRMTP
jgi:hypothetical protein